MLRYLLRLKNVIEFVSIMGVDLMQEQRHLQPGDSFELEYLYVKKLYNKYMSEQY